MSTMDLPTRKRPRHDSSSLSSSISNTKDGSNSAIGLFELFGGRNRERVKEKPKEKVQPFFTLRMEHREGGPMAQHYGEERILLFRSDVPGAVAKIIFSSTPAEEESWNDKDSSRLKCTEEADELERMAQAKVHVLSVKDQYRGYNLGGLLFSEAMSALRHRYHGDTDDTDESCRTGKKRDFNALHNSVRCQLDAEEDLRRYSKLVRFYERLGCRVKPTAKIKYINNNDGETYRKIPMQLTLKPGDERQSLFTKKGSIKKTISKFLPVTFLEGPGKPVKLSNHFDGPCNWLLVELGNGDLEFRTTSGLRLFATSDGQCMLSKNISSETQLECNPTFRLEGTSDKSNEVDSDGGSDAVAISTTEPCSKLWMVKTAYNSYLSVDVTSHGLFCCKDPIFWEAHCNDFSLRYTTDTPLLREFYRKMWKVQTVEYIGRMHEQYLDFSIRKMSFKDALDLVKDSPASPFQIRHQGSNPSLRGLLYRTAEATRAAGHPDWVQLVALVHGLASVMRYIDLKTVSDFDWTATCRTRIVGCKAPAGTIFEEFRSLNGDQHDVKFNSAKGMYKPGCGLDNVSLAWTGTEYMYLMLKHNQVAIPEEGLSILRYFSLQDWHTRNKYTTFASRDDDDIKEFVADIDELWSNANRLHVKAVDFDDEQCDIFWNSHYRHIARKYGADGLLMW